MMQHLQLMDWWVVPFENTAHCNSLGSLVTCVRSNKCKILHVVSLSIKSNINSNLNCQCNSIMKLRWVSLENTCRRTLSRVAMKLHAQDAHKQIFLYEMISADLLTSERYAEQTSTKNSKISDSHTESCFSNFEDENPIVIHYFYVPHLVTVWRSHLQSYNIAWWANHISPSFSTYCIVLR